MARTGCVDRFVDISSTLVRFVVELGTLVLAETRRAVGTRVHVTHAIALALTETVATTTSRPASPTNHATLRKLYLNTISQRLIIIITTTTMSVVSGAIIKTKVIARVHPVH